MRVLTLGVLFAACGGEARDLSTEQLSGVVAAQQPTLKRCYDVALERSPSAQELRLQAEIAIAPSGRVSSVEIDDGEVSLPGLSTCLREAISKWKFPQAREATHTGLPLIFKPEVVPSGPTLDDVQDVLRDIRKKQGLPEAQPAPPQAPAQPPPTQAAPPP
jgi:hypothetical protein